MEIEPIIIHLLCTYPFGIRNWGQYTHTIYFIYIISLSTSPAPVRVTFVTCESNKSFPSFAIVQILTKWGSGGSCVFSPSFPVVVPLYSSQLTKVKLMSMPSRIIKRVYCTVRGGGGNNVNSPISELFLRRTFSYNIHNFYLIIIRGLVPPDWVELPSLSSLQFVFQKIS